MIQCEWSSYWPTLGSFLPVTAWTTLDGQLDNRNIQQRSIDASINEWVTVEVGAVNKSSLSNSRVATVARLNRHETPKVIIITMIIVDTNSAPTGCPNDLTTKYPTYLTTGYPTYLTTGFRDYLTRLPNFSHYWLGNQLAQSRLMFQSWVTFAPNWLAEVGQLLHIFWVG